MKTTNHIAKWIQAVSYTHLARSANASSQTKSFINASLPIFHFRNSTV